jgi:hypothetical protein
LGVAQRERHGVVVGLRARDGVDRPDLAHTELAEDLFVALTGQLAEG